MTIAVAGLTASWPRFCSSLIQAALNLFRIDVICPVHAVECKGRDRARVCQPSWMMDGGSPTKEPRKTTVCHPTSCFAVWKRCLSISLSDCHSLTLKPLSPLSSNLQPPTRQPGMSACHEQILQLIGDLRGSISLPRHACAGQITKADTAWLRSTNYYKMLTDVRP